MKQRTRSTRCAVLTALALLLTAACATAPPTPAPARVLAPGDLGTLAGEWEGTLTGALGGGSFAGPRFPVRLTVKSDGTFTSLVDGKPGQGSARIVDGKLVYEGSNSRGTATLYEQGGRPLLKGEGTLVGYNGWSSFELTRR